MAGDFTARSKQLSEKPTELLASLINSKGSFKDALAATAKNTEAAISFSEANLTSLRSDIAAANTKLEHNTRLLNESGVPEIVRGYLVDKVEPLKKQIRDAHSQFESSILVLTRTAKKLAEWKTYLASASSIGASSARDAEKQIREEIRQELESLAKPSGAKN